ncbi:hypothetical protein ASZ90_020240 [hydrocarbon metagenome]|uniref:Uncharacterized protein n=1 Tax=hydrocarbon metagenome TaxID=938273 RepID=A0A0W8E1A9_9ZZZZ
MGIPGNLIIICLLFIGLVILQIYLSKRENKWLGLIFPSIFFLLSLMSVSGMYFYSETIREIILTVLPVFLVSNIPTIVFIGIYFACRESRRKNKEIEKMHIQDLS